MEFTLTFLTLLRFNFTSMQQVQTLGFIYLFLYSGMEFTLTLLTHLRFNFTSMQQV
jgi:hypothetical protein